MCRAKSDGGRRCDAALRLSKREAELDHELVYLQAEQATHRNLEESARVTASELTEANTRYDAVQHELAAAYTRRMDAPSSEREELSVAIGNLETESDDLEERVAALRAEKRDQEAKLADFREHQAERDERVNSLWTERKEVTAELEKHREAERTKEERREQRAREREAAREQREAEKRERRAARRRQARKGRKELSIYLTPTDHDALRAASFQSFVSAEEAAGTLDETMTKIGERAGLSTGWQEWRDDNPSGGAKEYLEQHQLSMGDATRYTGKSVLEPMRARLREPLSLQDDAHVSRIIEGEEAIPQFESAGVGRRRTSQGSADDVDARSKRVDISLTGDDLYRVEAYRSMFGLTLSDATRCSLLGEDPRQRRAHESIASYKRRLYVMEHTEESVASAGGGAQGYESVLSQRASKIKAEKEAGVVE